MASDEQVMREELNGLKDGQRKLETTMRSMEASFKEQLLEMKMSSHDQISEVKAETHGIKNNMQVVIGYSTQIQGLANKVDTNTTALNEHKLSSERALAVALTSLRADISSLKVTQAVTSTQIVTGAAMVAGLMGLAKVLFA